MPADAADDPGRPVVGVQHRLPPHAAVVVPLPRLTGSERNAGGGVGRGAGVLGT